MHGIKENAFIVLVNVADPFSLYAVQYGSDSGSSISKEFGIWIRILRLRTPHFT
jgi:hypothetical protein